MLRRSRVSTSRSTSSADAGRHQPHADLGEQPQRAQVALQFGRHGRVDPVAAGEPQLARDDVFAGRPVQPVDQGGDRPLVARRLVEHVAGDDPHLAQPPLLRLGRGGGTVLVRLGQDRRGDEDGGRDEGEEAHRCGRDPPRARLPLGPRACQTRST
jgi:hypothetical protein